MAMSLKPASLILARMAAVSPFFTASGLMMLKVRCDTNISWLRFECNSLAFWQLFQRKRERPFCSLEHTGSHGVWHVIGNPPARNSYPESQRSGCQSGILHRAFGLQDRLASRKF